VDSTSLTTGASAEDRAAAALEAAGYSIVARNWRCSAGELDIIAREGDVLVFVEVRSRASPAHGHAAEMVSRGKQRQVARIAGMYLAVKRPRFSRARFDVVAVTGARIDLIRDAWRVG
jgi:putative endonuclease